MILGLGNWEEEDNLTGCLSENYDLEGCPNAPFNVLNLYVQFFLGLLNTKLSSRANSFEVGIDGVDRSFAHVRIALMGPFEVVVLKPRVQIAVEGDCCFGTDGLEDGTEKLIDDRPPKALNRSVCPRGGYLNGSMLDVVIR